MIIEKNKKDMSANQVQTVEVLLLNYKDVINEIENKENHLLIGNGFNRSLCINTSYPEIFEKMIENNRGVYSEAMSIMDECCFDLRGIYGKA